MKRYRSLSSAAVLSVFKYMRDCGTISMRNWYAATKYTFDKDGYEGLYIQVQTLVNSSEFKKWEDKDKMKVSMVLTHFLEQEKAIHEDESNRAKKYPEFPAYKNHD